MKYHRNSRLSAKKEADLWPNDVFMSVRVFFAAAYVLDSNIFVTTQG